MPREPGSADDPGTPGGPVPTARHRRARHLLGVGALSLVWFVVLAVVSASDLAILVSAAVFALLLVALSLVLLPRARGIGTGSARRWMVAMALWGLALAVALAVGVISNRGAPAYWLFVGPLVAGSAWIGARAELQG